MCNCCRKWCGLGSGLLCKHPHSTTSSWSTGATQVREGRYFVTELAPFNMMCFIDVSNKFLFQVLLYTSVSDALEKSSD